MKPSSSGQWEERCSLLCLLQAATRERERSGEEGRLHIYTRGLLSQRHVSPAGFSAPAPTSQYNIIVTVKCVSVSNPCATMSSITSGFLPIGVQCLYVTHETDIGTSQGQTHAGMLTWMTVRPSSSIPFREVHM